jgi:thiol-disulfide isomerase/thioredoxin
VPGLGRQLRNILLLLLLSVAVSVAGIVISSHIHPPTSLLPVGMRAPAIQPSTNGPPVPDEVAANAGHPLLVEFFETGCPVCQQAAPQLCDLLTSHAAASLVAVDAIQEDAAAVDAFRRDRYAGCASLSRISLLIDPCAAGSQTSAGGVTVCDTVTSRWKVTVVPTLYVVDASGVIVGASSGTGAVDDARAALDRIGAGASPSQ